MSTGSIGETQMNQPTQQSKVQIEVVEHEIDVPNAGKLKVYVQGNIADRHGKTVFLTCHDIGTNHRGWFPFLSHATMNSVRDRSIFLHVCVPGQEDNADALPEKYQFPTLEQLGEDLTHVVDHFNCKHVVGIGDGAGANIIVRFAINNPNRCLGVILIHCTVQTSGVLEYVSSKFTNWKLGSGGMSQSAYDYIVQHKFGNVDSKDPRVQAFMACMKTALNDKNLFRYLEAYQKRGDISGALVDKLKVDALLIVGARTTHVPSVYQMHQNMNKSGTTLLVVDDVADVLSESPYKVARALILFCKGCGALSGVGIPGMERQRTLSGSMEEADKPRKLSLSFNKAIERMPE